MPSKQFIATFPLHADVDFNGFKAKNMLCDSGPTLPVAPGDDQWFVQDATGREWLMIYNPASGWLPITSLGATTLYVDGTLGTDSQDQGTGTGTAAYKSISYAWSQVPGTLAGNVVINVAEGTYSGALTLQGKTPRGAYTITIQGAYTATPQRALTTVSSATAGSATADATLTVNAASMTTNQYKGMILKFAANTTTVALRSQEYMIVGNNSAVNSVITIVGAWVAGFGTTPSATDTFTIEKAGVVISGAIIVLGAQQGLYFDKVNPTTSVQVKETSVSNFTLSDLSSSGTTITSRADNFSSMKFSKCYIRGTGNARRIFAVSSYVEIPRCLIDGANITTQPMIDASNLSVVTPVSSTCHIQNNAGTSYGVWVRGGSQFNMFVDTVTTTKGTISGNTTGIRAETGGQSSFSSATYVTFTGNTTDTSADAATYGAIT